MMLKAFVETKHEVDFAEQLVDQGCFVVLAGMPPAENFGPLVRLFLPESANLNLVARGTFNTKAESKPWFMLDSADSIGDPAIECFRDPSWIVMSTNADVGIIQMNPDIGYIFQKVHHRILPELDYVRVYQLATKSLRDRDPDDVVTDQFFAISDLARGMVEKRFGKALN